jgi:toxin-antitoxin system PIN domain toxin
MPAFTTSFLFPDVNVWVALTHGRHIHHLVAQDWFTSLEADVRLCFCRFTQLGLLRLLTAEAVMSDEVLSQAEAWAVYDRWFTDDRVEFVEEPHGLERRFRGLTRGRLAVPKTWADAYLTAFADASQLTLVTFDRAFRGKARPLILLEAAEAGE